MSTQPVPFLDLAGMHQPLQPELDAVWREVTANGAFIAGELAERFEAGWAAYLGAAEVIGVANGTDSLELILRALGIGPGDEVIIPANTFIATAEAAVSCGATPVFVDVDPATLLVTAETIAPAIGPRTAAIMPVHLYGQPCAMDDIVALAERRGLAVVEDAAQAHGARWKGRPAGTIGTAGSFSFYPGKNLGAFGDAGAVVTDDPALAARVRSLANHGRADGAHVVHPLMGRNSRLDGIQAGVLEVKLRHLDEWNDRRRQWRDRFVAGLEGSPARPVVEGDGAHSVWHLNVVQVPQRDAVQTAMQARGIDVRIHYPHPCHQHAMVTDPPALPVVEAATRRILSLPMSPTMTVEQIDTVCDALVEVLHGLPAEGPR